MTPTPTTLPCRALAALALAATTVLAAAPAAAQVGLQRATWMAGAAPGVLLYPTAAAATPQRFGPFELQVAPGAAPTSGRHPLVVISHGTGGHELGHAWLAERLVAAGFIVAALRHPGDNYEDRSGVVKPDYFVERPRAVSRVLDELLADPRWAPLIDAERIALVGHSAGGHTVLALAGGQPDRARVMAHCGAGAVGLSDDAAMCALGGFSTARPAPVPVDPAPLPAVRDARVRAAVALAPLGIALTPASVAAISVPLHVEYGGRDEVLTPRFHAQAVCAAQARATCVGDAQAGHFAAFQPVSQRMGPPGLDPAWNPQGFDRRAWQAAAGPRIVRFLGQALALPVAPQ